MVGPPASTSCPWWLRIAPSRRRRGACSRPRRARAVRPPAAGGPTKRPPRAVVSAGRLRAGRFARRAPRMPAHGAPTCKRSL